MPLSVGYTSVSPIGELFYASRSGGIVGATSAASVNGGTVVITDTQTLVGNLTIPADVGMRRWGNWYVIAQ